MPSTKTISTGSGKMTKGDWRALHTETPSFNTQFPNSIESDSLASLLEPFEFHQVCSPSRPYPQKRQQYYSSPASPRVHRIPLRQKKLVLCIYTFKVDTFNTRIPKFSAQMGLTCSEDLLWPLPGFILPCCHQNGAYP